MDESIDEAGILMIQLPLNNTAKFPTHEPFVGSSSYPK